MKIPKPVTGSIKTIATLPTSTQVIAWLEAGDVLTGPGSDVHDTYFFKQGNKYVYCIEYQTNGADDKTVYTFPATDTGYYAMVTCACFMHASKFTRKR
jgi:hypothetical protein